MASNSICSACLRAARQQARINLRQTNPTRTRVQHPFQRTFITSIRRTEEDKRSKPPPPPKANYKSIVPDPKSIMPNLAKSLRNNSALHRTTEPYVAYGGTEYLFEECNRQCAYTIGSALSSPAATPKMNEAGDHLGEGSGWWLEPKSKGGLGLEVTFNSWAQVLFLHMWMLTVRLRDFPEKYVNHWHRNLLDHFFYAAEDRMAMWHGMSARSVRNKNLKDLWLQWRGVQLGYDEGLVKGDAVFATALWRNLFKANPGVDMSDMALVTGYVMRELQRLGKADDTQLMEGRVKFGDPKLAPRKIAHKARAPGETSPAPSPPVTKA